MTAPTFDQVIEQTNQALDEFIKGNPDPMKQRFSHQDDVSLANPFGPAVRGWSQVVAVMDRAAEQLREGECTYENLVTLVTPELVFIVQVERFRARVGSSQEIMPVALRVTMIFRPEDGTWKVVHRHADPITSPRPPESIIQQRIDPARGTRHLS